MTQRELGPAASGATVREQRLAAAGRVAAGLLHEFRNVLSPISNLAFVLEQQAHDPDRVRDLARRLGGMAHAKGRVTDRLRDFLLQDAARFPDGAVVDLSVVARETVALCATLATARQGAGTVTLQCDVAGPLPVRGDGADLRTAAFELILNAIEALPAGGTVLVRTLRAQDRAVLEVRDDGPGIADGIAEVLYDPFISTKGQSDAGLGLSAVWGIVRRHGGDLAVDTSALGGAVATLTLPLSSTDD